MQLYYLLFVLFVTECLAETKWVWERNYNSDPYASYRRDDYNRELSSYRYPNGYSQYGRDRYREFDRIRDIERQRERDRERDRDRERERDRHRDREQITVRPYTRPGSGQEDFDDYDIDDQKYNYDQFGPLARPIQPRPLPPIQNLRPNPQNGILVGPEGPTGIIGRPNNNINNIGIDANRLPITNGIPNPNDLRPNIANGVLVGPGGPTGIIGRPQYGGGGASGGFGNNYPPIGPNGVGSNNFGPQVFPPSNSNPGVNGIRPIATGPGGGPIGGIYPNPAGPDAYPTRPGLYPGNGIYGYPNVVGGNGVSSYGNGNIYPGYPGNGGQQQGQYGLYPSQYYPIGPYGQGSLYPNVGGGNGGRPYPNLYNNDLDGDNYGNNEYYAPGYDQFGRSASNADKTKDKNKSGIKFESRKVKKSIVDDKLADI